MMSEIKKIWKLAKYAYHFMFSAVFAVCFTIFGMFFSVSGAMMSKETQLQPAMLGTLYILLSSSMLIQVTYSLLFSNVVKSSPKNYILEITAPNFYTSVIGVAAYIITIITALIGAKYSPDLAAGYSVVILNSGILIAVIVLYFGAAYKYFVASTIFFMIGFGLSFGGVNYMFYHVGFPFELTILNTSLISAVIVIAGIVGSGILRKVLYRKPLSKLSMGAHLRKALQ